MKRWGKKSIALLLAVFMILTYFPYNNLTAYAANETGNEVDKTIESVDDTDTEADAETTDDTDIEDDTEAVGTASATSYGQYMPLPSDYDAPVVHGNTDLTDEVEATYGSLPTLYPSDRSNLPSTRSQNPYGTCWAFTSIAMAELSLINKNLATTSVDLSELHLAYFSEHTVTDPLGGTEGDSTQYYDYNGTGYNYLQLGGNMVYAMQALANWIGAADESTVPYSNASRTLTAGLDSTLAYDDVAHLENGYLINIKENQEDAKSAILKYGAIGTSYYDDDRFYNDSTNAYYCTYAESMNHAVTIVGWDDNFSKTNFSSTPAGNGAWLIRNSWTDGNEDRYGYFWMSYYDESLANTSYVFDVNTNENYDNNYQYDGGLNTISSDYKIGANVFTVNGDSSTGNENLDAVSVAFEDAEVNYTVKIYTDLADISNPTSGNLQSAATTSGTTSYRGIHTIKLNAPVSLYEGETFAVVVEADKRIAVESDVNSCSWLKFECETKSGQSFGKSGNTWLDFKNVYTDDQYVGNLRIKAYTTNDETTQDGIYAIRFIANGGSGKMETMKNCQTGVSYRLSSNTYTRTGYKFAGWNTRADGTGISYTDGQSVTNLINSGTYTFYAQWTPIRYTVHFDANGGTSTLQDVECEYGTYTNYAPMSGVSNTGGKTLCGWNTKADGTGTQYECGNYLPDLTTTDGAVVTLYARWHYGTYTLSYQNTNSAYNNNKTSYYTGGTAITLSNLSRSGYTFNGWYATYQSGVYSNPITVITDAVIDKYAVNSTLTLYAKWTELVPNPSISKWGYSSSSISLYWTAVSGARGYRVDYYNTSTNKWAKLTQTTNTNYTHSGLASGSSIQYRVFAYKSDSAGNTIYSSGTIYNAATLPNSATNIKSTGQTDTSITLNWTKGAGGRPDRYVIYRSTDNQTYVQVAEVNGTVNSYTDTGLSSAKNYYYRIGTYKVATNGSGSRYIGVRSSSYRFSTKPTKVAGFKQTGNNTSAIKLGWSKTSGASGYQVYRATSANGSYSRIATISGGSTVSYTNSGLNAGKTYYYKIRAYRKVDGVVYYGTSSTALTTVTAPSKTSGVKSAAQSASAIKVAWTKVSGASGYRIYYRTSTKNSWTNLATVSGGSTVSYMHSNLSAGKTYYYCVRAYRTTGSYHAWGATSSGITTSTKPRVVTGFKQSGANASAVKLVWSKVSGASGYQVYRATSANGSYSRIATISGGSTVSYTNSGLKAGKTYYYKIRAYRTVNQVNYYGGSTSAIKTVTSPSKTTGVKATPTSTTSMKITWTKVSGASGYRVYYRKSTKDKWSVAATNVSGGNSVSYTQTGLNVATTYYYCVRAYRASGSYNAWGSTSASVTASTQPAVVTGTTQTGASTSAIRLKWNKVSRVSGYQIYRSTSSTSGFKKIATVTNGNTVTYQDKKLKAGTKYYYRVRAYRTVNNVNYYSGYTTYEATTK